mgnify:CR=1 FL=1
MKSNIMGLVAVGLLAGPLTVTAPQLLIAVHLAGVFAAYCARHPGVELSVNASNLPLNLHPR